MYAYDVWSANRIERKQNQTKIAILNNMEKSWDCEKIQKINSKIQ